VCEELAGGLQLGHCARRAEKESRAAGSERERGFTLETAQREFTVL